MLAPLSYEIQLHETIVGARVIAVLVRVRAQQVWTINMYVHAQERQYILEPHIVCGDFNQSDVYQPALWQQLIAASGAEDVDPKLPTFYDGEYAPRLIDIFFPLAPHARGTLISSLRRKENSPQLGTRL